MINDENNLIKLSEELLKNYKVEYDYKFMKKLKEIKKSMTYVVLLFHVFTSLGLNLEESKEIINEIFILKSMNRLKKYS